MIDAHNTTVDWQGFTPDIAVLPVGSIEQHDAHLPVSTDCIQVDAFGKTVAEGLNAALLPTLPYSNCLEHSGFRGTFSLRPETLAQVIHDLAEEIERQQFKFLIVLNGHGGNFVLVPAIRAWNRKDRPLKILLVNFWEFSDPASNAPSAHPLSEIHAGEWETSLMMALRPELVRAPGAGMPEGFPDPFPLQQRDLTTFGVGHFNPEGAVGFPAEATPEKGRAIVASIKAAIMPWIRNRIDRLRINPRYSGSGGILVRRRTTSDLFPALRLDACAGGDRTEADLNFFDRQFPETSWAAVHNGALIGTVAAAVYDARIAWVAPVLVDPEFRRLGVESQLMAAALGALKDVSCIRIAAGPENGTFFERFGFMEDVILHRMICRSVPPWSDEIGGVRPMTEQDLPQAIQDDAEAFGVRRDAVLRHLFQRAPALAWRGEKNSFCLGRAARGCTRIGPIVASNAPAAAELLRRALRTLAGQPVVVDIPDSHSGLRKNLAALGFVCEGALPTLCRKQKTIAANSEQTFAVAGPEFG